MGPKTCLEAVVAGRYTEPSGKMKSGRPVCGIISCGFAARPSHTKETAFRVRRSHVSAVYVNTLCYIKPEKLLFRASPVFPREYS